MKRLEKIRCKKRLYDRDFLFGIFPKSGFVASADELQNTNLQGIIPEENGDIPGQKENLPGKEQ